jgi:hypothetical protein
LLLGNRQKVGASLATISYDVVFRIALQVWGILVPIAVLLAQAHTTKVTFERSHRMMSFGVYLNLLC